MVVLEPDPKIPEDPVRKTMKKTFPFLLLFAAFSPLLAEEWEAPNFSLLGNLGGNFSTGFIAGTRPAPEAGLWVGASLSQRFDGLWGADYYSMTGPPFLIPRAIPGNAQAVTLVKPTDDLALTVNIRWYWSDKWDLYRRKFNTVPYLIGGMGMDLVVDEYPRPESVPFYNATYDLLFSMNLGAGIDMPLGDAQHWMLYAEGLDHLVFWRGTTQILTVRAGIKVMLDGEHLDPFR